MCVVFLSISNSSGKEIGLWFNYENLLSSSKFLIFTLVIRLNHSMAEHQSHKHLHLVFACHYMLHESLLFFIQAKKKSKKQYSTMVVMIFLTLLYYVSLVVWCVVWHHRYSNVVPKCSRPIFEYLWRHITHQMSKKWWQPFLENGCAHEFGFTDANS